MASSRYSLGMRSCLTTSPSSSNNSGMDSSEMSWSGTSFPELIGKRWQTLVSEYATILAAWVTSRIVPSGNTMASGKVCLMDSTSHSDTSEVPDLTVGGPQTPKYHCDARQRTFAKWVRTSIFVSVPLTISRSPDGPIGINDL